MRLQPIENLSKTYSGDPHLGQTKLNGLLLLTIHGVLSGHQGGIKCANRRTGFIDSEGSHQSQDPKDPKHMLFCRETAVVAIYTFFSGVLFSSFDRNSNIFAIFIEQKSYG